MGILNTIWTSLTLENPVIINLLGIPLTVIEVVVTMLLFTQVLNIVSVKKQKIIYVAVFSAIAIISQCFITPPYNTFVNIIFQFVLVLVLFKTNLLKTILCIIFPLAVFVCIASIMQLLFLWILSFSITSNFLIPIYRICFSLTEYSMIYLIYRLFKYFNIKITLFDNMHKNTFAILIFNFTLGILAIAVQLYLITIYADIVPINILIIDISVLFVYFLVSIYSLLRTNNLEITKHDLEMEKEHNKTINGLYDSIRGFRHDFNNIVQAIGGYISTENMAGLKSYHSDLMEDCQRVNNLTILSPEIINNPAIYSLLTSKYHTADELGIKINLEVFLDLSKINMKIYELTRILGILIDNAIEASHMSQEKIINIVIRKDLKANKQLFLIENTYSNKAVDIDKIFEKGFTDKYDETGKNHGLGLWEVRKILKRNNNLNLYTSKNNQFFKQQFEIYN